MNTKVGQAGLPRGLIGRVLGRVMALHNRPDNVWTVDLLAISDTDRVLEVGFGPGQAVKLVSDANPSSHIAGIDHSEDMLASARQLNRKAVAAGRVDLKLGSVEALPFAGCTFDKAFSINCIYFWQEPLGGLCELYRVLKPAGRLAITVRDKKREAYQRFRPENLKDLLVQAGFASVNVQHNGVSAHPLICAVGTK